MILTDLKATKSTGTRPEPRIVAVPNSRSRPGLGSPRRPASCDRPPRGAGGHFKAGVNGFAAGALLVMLVDSMIPEATSKSGRVAGLVTTLGFAVAAGLSTATG